MKILKIFGIVVGIHVFALVLIFANPGCSATTKPAPAPADTVAKTESVAPITVPNTSPTIAVAAPPPPLPADFNPDAPASSAPSVGVRFTPTRPNTPVASTLVAEPVKDVTPMTTYIVKSGDSLWSIANKNKLSVQEVAAANSLKSTTVLQPGQKLIIPGKSSGRTSAVAAEPATVASKPASAAAASAKPTASGMKHTVQSGETLGSIAQKYGVRQRDLAIANNVTDPLKLAAGKELVIPGWDPANGKPPGKSSTKSSGTSASTPKPAADARPFFTTPQLDQPAPVISAQPPTPAGEVPVIRVDETPAKKP